jgi:uncharacterized protein (TIGR04255 family)
MTQSDATIPSFSMPPVVEAAIGFEFAPVDKLGMYGLSAFYDRVKADYPDLEEHLVGAGPLPAPFPIPPVPRFWMLRNGGSDLVQLQHDRLFLNWRQLDRGIAYPRYAAQRAELTRLTEVLASVASELESESLVPLWAESTYVNRIEFAAGKNPHDFFVLVSGSNELPGRIEETRFQQVRDVSFDATDGRCVLSVEPFSDQDTIGATMTVVTRVSLTGADTIQSSFGLLDYARKISVQAFAAATTPEMHAEWGRE